jgi:hypothetical protein
VTGQFSVLAGALADPGQLTAVQAAFCPAVSGVCDSMQLEWQFPVAVGQVNADQAQAFSNALAVAADSPYSSELESVAPDLAVAEPMADTLTAFITAQTAVLAVLLLLFASLAAIVVVVIMLAFAAAAGCALALPVRSARRWTCWSSPARASRSSSVRTWPRSACRAR